MRRFPDGASQKGGQAAVQAHRDDAHAFYAPLLPIVAEMHARGLSIRDIALELAARGIRTRHGFTCWSESSVRRMLLRIRAGGVQPATLPSNDTQPPPTTAGPPVADTQTPPTEQQPAAVPDHFARVNELLAELYGR